MSNPKNSEAQIQAGPKKVGRRALLKTLAATGGAVAASTMLPNKWSKPIVTVGVLPAHAQASPMPTATPLQHVITTCSVANVQGGGTIGPTDSLQTFADISPTTANIQMRRTITLNEAGHPQNGDVDVATGVTDATGRFSPPDFDLSTISPTISPGVDRISVRWEFVNASDGTGACVNLIEIILN